MKILQTLKTLPVLAAFASVGCVSHQNRPLSELDEVIPAISSFDLDGDGTISKAEADNYIRIMADPNGNRDRKITGRDIKNALDIAGKLENYNHTFKPFGRTKHPNIEASVQSFELLAKSFVQKRLANDE